MLNRNMISKVVKSREFGITLVILMLGTMLSFVTETFLTLSNLNSVALGFCADGIIAFGMTFILISGQIDLSVGSVMGLSAVITAKLFVTYGVNIWLSALAAIVIAIGFGSLIGWLIAHFRAVPFIITLGMQGVARGLCYVLTSGAPIAITGDAVQGFRKIGGGNVGGIATFVIILAALAIICQFMLRKTKYFAKVYFIGSNEKAAAYAGVDVTKTKIILYAISSFLACLAGLLSLSRFGVATATLGAQAESRAITAAVIGGTAMSGGMGSILGTVLGLIMVHFVTNGLVLLRVSIYWQDFASYLMLVLVIVFDTVRQRRDR
ncbi:MAG: ABC transporter permease [Clostridia bacterium]|nr:ABC transporter permease [Clostridia bacterium]